MAKIFHRILKVFRWILGVALTFTFFGFILRMMTVGFSYESLVICLGSLGLLVVLEGGLKKSFWTEESGILGEKSNIKRTKYLHNLNCKGIYRVKKSGAEITLDFKKTSHSPAGPRGNVRLINKYPDAPGPFGGIVPARGNWRLDNNDPTNRHVFIRIECHPLAPTSATELMLGPYYSGLCDDSERLELLVFDHDKETESLYKVKHEPNAKLDIENYALEAWLNYAEPPRTDGLYRGRVKESWSDSDCQMHEGSHVDTTVLFLANDDGISGQIKGVSHHHRLQSDTPGWVAFKGTWSRTKDKCLQAELHPMTGFTIKSFDPGDVKYMGYFIGRDDILASGKMLLENYGDRVWLMAKDEFIQHELKFDAESSPADLLKKLPDNIRSWLTE